MIAKAERSVEKEGKHLRNAGKYHDRVRFWFGFFFYAEWHTELANAVNPKSLISCCLIHNYTTVSSDWFWLDKRNSRVLIWSLKAPGPVTLCITPPHRWWWHEWKSWTGFNFWLNSPIWSPKRKKQKNKEDVYGNCHQLWQQVLQLDHRGSHLKWMFFSALLDLMVSFLITNI